jgi:anhydro-N-acetylmuramic acid kinase
MLMIGLMSGTSADGIDAALVEITGEGRATKVRLIQFLCVPHTPEMRAAILALCNPATATVPDLCAMNFAVAERFAEAAHALAGAAGVALSKVDAIASHGQTVWHQPVPLKVGGIESIGTLQIGEPAVIAARTGCKVVANFRTADMAAGGQGAPLVPYADWALLTSDTESRAVLNIGGIANVTHLPRGATPDEVLAFDTGPGNMLLDALVSRFTNGEKKHDEGGECAAQGRYNSALGEWLLSDPYFSQPPPKSTGRELFSTEFVERLVEQARLQTLSEEDILATVTAFTAKTIQIAFEQWLIPCGGVDTVIVGGGGSHNKTLMQLLGKSLAPARLTTHEEFGIPNDAKEAMAFALLGYETLHGRPSNIPSATGASRPAILGSITNI